MKNLQKWQFRLLIWAVLLGGLVFTGVFNRWQTPVINAAGESCTVQASGGLNLREGPGSNYAIKGLLPNGSKVTPVATISNRSYVRVRSGTKDGWVSASFVNCNVALSQLPVQMPPPTPTRNNRPTPTATPFQVSYTDAPNQGGNLDGLEGSILIPRSAIVPGTQQIVFRDFLIFQVDTRDPEAIQGNGIKQVTFRIIDDSGEDIYRNEEGAAPYCLFKNDGNRCNVVWFFNQTNNRWPGNQSDFARLSNLRIDPNVEYRAQVSAIGVDDQKRGDWDFRFRIIPTGTPPHAVYTVPSSEFSIDNFEYDAEIRVQYDTVVDPNGGNVVFNKRMAFQLYVFDSNSGEEAEDVGAVEFLIQDDSDGQIVYQHTEINRPYCVFGNTENYCETIWEFSDTNYLWPPSDEGSGVPNNIRVRSDRSYTAYMIVYDQNGDQIGTWNFFLEVQ